VYARLEDPVGVLSVALGVWEDRDDSIPQPEVRQAASTAVDTIDALTRELFNLRQRLIGEIRRSDDESMLRTEALLAGIRARREAGQSGDAAMT
jgi:hypothetical protein